jgi:arginine repressor
VQLELDGFVTEDGEPVTSCWLSPTEVDSVSSGRPAKDIPVEIAVAIVKEYPGASQNELSEFLAERASEIMDKKVSKDTAKRLLQKLASLEPPRLIRIEDGKRISYRVTEADESQSPKKEDAA